MVLPTAVKDIFKSSVTGEGGEGGTLLLINGTPYPWKRGDNGSYQMNSWSFPREIKPGMKSDKSFWMNTDKGKAKLRRSMSNSNRVLPPSVPIPQATAPSH